MNRARVRGELRGSVSPFLGPGEIVAAAPADCRGSPLFRRERKSESRERAGDESAFASAMRKNTRGSEELIIILIIQYYNE